MAIEMAVLVSPTEHASLWNPEAKVISLAVDKWISVFVVLNMLLDSVYNGLSSILFSVNFLNLLLDLSVFNGLADTSSGELQV